MSRVLRQAPLVLGVLGCASCSVLFNVDGFAGDGSTDAATDIAARDVVREASPDASGSDASSDAPIDHRPDGAKAGPWCASQTTPPDAAFYLCLDYDEPDVGLPNQQISCTGCDGGPVTIAIQADTDPSSPNALVVSLPPYGAYPDNAVAFDVYDGKTGTTLDLAFDFRATNTDPAILSVLASGNVYYSLALYPYLKFDEYQSPVDGGPLSAGHPFDAGVSFLDWHRVDLHLTTETKGITIKVDGKEVLDEPLSLGPDGAEAAYYLGVQYAGGPRTAGSYHYDNVVMVTH
jgi:hypothetical protein